MIKNSFTEANKHLTIIKPELKLFLKNKQELGQEFIALLDLLDTDKKDKKTISYINIIDIFDPKLSPNELKSIYEESLDMTGIVECMTDQLRFITNAKIIICHHIQKELQISLDNSKTKFFIIAGETEQINVSCNDSETYIYHHVAREEECSVFFGEIEADAIYSSKLSIPIPTTGRGKPNPPSSELIKIIDGTETVPQIASSVEYIIDLISASRISLKAPITKIISGNILDINMNTGNHQNRCLLIVHGQIKTINFSGDTIGSLEVLFTDLSDFQVKGLVGGRNDFYGIDHPPTNSYGKEYCKGKTITESLVARTKFTNVQCAIIDSFANVFSLKKRQEKMFDNLMANYMKQFPEEKDRGTQLGKLVAEEALSLRFEDKLSTQMRVVLEQRYKDLRNASNVAPPVYILEAVRIDMLVVNQNQIREKELQNKNVKIEHELFVLIEPNKDYFIHDKNAIHIHGDKDTKCFVKDCGLVVVKGECLIIVCGKIHTLITSAKTTVVFDNVSEEQLADNAYLFLESSSIFDSVGKWQNMTKQEIEEFYAPNDYDKNEERIVPDELTQRDIFHRAIVKVFAYGKTPSNIHTASIRKKIPLLS
jgi:hypothetical protein